MCITYTYLSIYLSISLSLSLYIYIHTYPPFRSLRSPARLALRAEQAEQALPDELSLDHLVLLKVIKVFRYFCIFCLVILGCLFMLSFGLFVSILCYFVLPACPRSPSCRTPPRRRPCGRSCRRCCRRPRQSVFFV